MPTVQNGNPAFPESGEGTLVTTGVTMIDPLRIGPYVGTGAPVLVPTGADYSPWLNGRLNIGFNQDSAPVPEPGTLALLLVGALGLMWRVRRR